MLRMEWGKLRRRREKRRTMTIPSDPKRPTEKRDRESEQWALRKPFTLSLPHNGPEKCQPTKDAMTARSNNSHLHKHLYCHFFPPLSRWEIRFVEKYTTHDAARSEQWRLKTMKKIKWNVRERYSVRAARRIYFLNFLSYTNKTMKNNDGGRWRRGGWGRAGCARTQKHYFYPTKQSL